MNPEAMRIIANQRLAEMHHEAASGRLARKARQAKPGHRWQVRRLVRLVRPQPRPRPATSTGR